MHCALFDSEYVAHKQKLDNIRQFFLDRNALALSDEPKISLMESSLASMWVASAIKSKCVVALYCGGVSVDGHALDFL